MKCFSLKDFLTFFFFFAGVAVHSSLAEKDCVTRDTGKFSSGIRPFSKIWPIQTTAGRATMSHLRRW